MTVPLGSLTRHDQSSGVVSAVSSSVTVTTATLSGGSGSHWKFTNPLASVVSVAGAPGAPVGGRTHSNGGTSVVVTAGLTVMSQPAVGS